MLKKAVILLPTYNEKDNIEQFTQEVLKQEKKIPGFKLEILIVDSKSTDGTEKIIINLTKKNGKVHFLSVERGLGVALVEGHKYSIRHLHPDVLVQIDSDGQVKVDIIPKLIKTIQEGYDLAIGSRFIRGGENKLSLTRKIFSYGASLVYRILIGPFDIKEVTNSARAFTPELFQKINFKRIPWEKQTFIIQPAFLNEAILAGAKYKEIPLVFKDRPAGYSKNKTIKYTRDILVYCINTRLKKWGINLNLF